MQCVSPKPVRIASSLILCDEIADDLDFHIDLDVAMYSLIEVAENVAMYVFSNQRSHVVEEVSSTPVYDLESVSDDMDNMDDSASINFSDNVGYISSRSEDLEMVCYDDDFGFVPMEEDPEVDITLEEEASDDEVDEAFASTRTLLDNIILSLLED